MIDRLLITHVDAGHIVSRVTVHAGGATSRYTGLDEGIIDAHFDMFNKAENRCQQVMYLWEDGSFTYWLGFSEGEMLPPMEPQFRDPAELFQSGHEALAEIIDDNARPALADAQAADMAE